jgi:hypothetical protein
MTAARITRQEALAAPALLSFTGAPVASMRTSSIGSMRILEREAQLARLTEQLGATRRGSGRLVMVAGEAGIGKTSLVDAFLAALPRGTRALRGGCDPVIPARPFAPIADMAMEGGDGLREALATADRDRVFDGFLAFRAGWILCRRNGSDRAWPGAGPRPALTPVGPKIGSGRGQVGVRTRQPGSILRSSTKQQESNRCESVCQ